jgi:hypothetical protein
LRGIFGRKGEETSGTWIKLHSHELYNFCSSQNIIKVIKLKRMRPVGKVRHGRDEEEWMYLFSTTHGMKRSIGKPKRGCEVNTKIVHKIRI